MSEELFRAKTPSGESELFAKAVAIGRGRCYVPIGCMNVSYQDSDLTDLRPVRIVEERQVVIEEREADSLMKVLPALTAEGSPKRFLDVWHLNLSTADFFNLSQLANQLKAQSEPPKMEEPEWGGMVWAYSSGEWDKWLATTDPITLRRIYVSPFGTIRNWSDLANPRLILDSER